MATADTKKLFKFAPAHDLGAPEDFPVGSVEWAERISKRLQIGAGSITQHTVHHLWDTIKAIWTVNPHPWEIWPDGNPFETPDDYCLAVTGHSWEFLVGLVAEFKGNSDISTEGMRAELARRQAEHRPQGKHISSTANKPLRNEGGDSPSKLLRRLARDHPDILARYERGEFKSARAAAIAAGIVKPKTPLEQILKLLPKLTDAERDQLRSAL